MLLRNTNIMSSDCHDRLKPSTLDDRHRLLGRQPEDTSKTSKTSSLSRLFGMTSSRSPRSLSHWTCQILLVFILSTLILMVWLTHSHSTMEQKDAVLKRKAEIKEQVRLERLRALQKVIFKHPRRPDDSTYNINVTLSEQISLERDIVDSRHEQCRDVTYDTHELPTISIIIIFYNEALSMLLRTVHSILARTPEHLLQDIILVNDHSNNDDLFEPLERYLKLLPDKVKMVRTKKREGLIRARLIGAQIAKGPVIMFQDAHTENNVGWVEPLLTEIKRNRKVIIQPVVDQVEANTIEYIGATDTVPRGGFSWDLRYTWMEMPDHERKRLKSPTEPFRTATLVGCALAADKEYFLEIGGFDDDFEIWGGENIELAWRNWMCGGEVLTHPCSRVAHTFKPFAYKFDGDREKIVQKNLMRTAELWMDDWKKFFYASTYNWPSKRTYFTEKDLESLEKRRELKRQLQCKGFDWYMENIAPEIPKPPMDADWYGEIFNEKSEACWYMADDGYVALTYFCFFHRTLPQNNFYIDTNQRLIYREKCIRVDYKTWLLKEGDCASEGEEVWDVDRYGEVRGLIRVTLRLHGEDTAMCVLQVTNVNTVHNREQMPQLVPCDNSKPFMYWRWTYKFDFNYNFDKPY